MATLQLSNVNNALQKVILPFIQDNFNKETILMDQLKRNAGVRVFNDNFYAPVRTQRHGGITNLANDGNSLVSGKVTISQASVPVKIITGTFEITDLVIAASKSDKLAVENLLNFSAKTLGDDYAKDVNRQMFGDGVGVLAEVATSGSVGVGTIALQRPTSSLDDGRSIDNYGTVNGDISPVEYIFPDMVLGIGTAGADLGTVTSVSGNTIIVTGAPAVNNNDAIYRADGSGEGSGTSEITGIRAALSSSTGTSTYAGLARSTMGWAPQIGTAAGALTIAEMERRYLAARKFSKSGDKFAIFANLTLYQKYADLLTAMRRTVNQTELLGGWTGIEFAAGAGKVGVFLDYDTPDGEVIILNLDSWTICQVDEMGWMEEPNTGALVRSRGNLKFEATMRWYMNLICLAPGSNARLTQKTA